MSQAPDMTETTANIVGIAVAAVVWLAWTFLSETRHNHGFWVAFLMPLAPIIIPALWIIFLFIKYSSYLVFVVLQRRENHEEFIRQLKIHFGVFLLF